MHTYYWPYIFISSNFAHNVYKEVNIVCNNIAIQMAEILVLENVRTVAFCYFFLFFLQLSASKTQPFKVQSLIKKYGHVNLLSEFISIFMTATAKMTFGRYLKFCMPLGVILHHAKF